MTKIKIVKEMTFENGSNQCIYFLVFPCRKYQANCRHEIGHSVGELEEFVKLMNEFINNEKKK